MNSDQLLKGKSILIVDDEPDILETVADVLDMCLVDKASSYEEAIQYLQGYTHDIVILDIMGVNGFALLQNAVDRGIPAVMLTAHALTPEALKKAIKLGAVSFLPKDKILELPTFLGDVVLGQGKPVWKRLFVRLENSFNRHFGPDWRERDKFLNEFEESMK